MLRAILILTAALSVSFFFNIAEPSLFAADDDEEGLLGKRADLLESVLMELLELRQDTTKYKAGVHPYSVEMKQAILDKHNEKRAAVIPSAGNMLFMNWNDDLAKDAGNWASTCQWWHESRTGLGSNGQNLWIGRRNPDGVACIDAWDNEKRFYDFENNVCEEGKMCGHYWQTVWSKASEVGCARAFCPKVAKNETHFIYNQWIFACHYDIGVYKGALPYIADDRCALCPEDHRACSGGALCREPNHCSADNPADCDCRLKYCAEGELDEASCTCRCCQPGYWKSVCTACTDNKGACGEGKAYKDTRYCAYGIVQKKCPVMCKTCRKWECGNGK